MLDGHGGGNDLYKKSPAIAGPAMQPETVDRIVTPSLLPYVDHPLPTYPTS